MRQTTSLCPRKVREKKIKEEIKTLKRNKEMFMERLKEGKTMGLKDTEKDKEYINTDRQTSKHKEKKS